MAAPIKSVLEVKNQVCSKRMSNQLLQDYRGVQVQAGLTLEGACKQPKDGVVNLPKPVLSNIQLATDAREHSRAALQAQTIGQGIVEGLAARKIIPSQPQHACFSCLPHKAVIE